MQLIIAALSVLLVWYILNISEKRRQRILNVVVRLDRLGDPRGCVDSLDILAEVEKIYWFPFEKFGYPGRTHQVFTLATSSLWRYIQRMDTEINMFGQKKIIEILHSSNLSSEMLAAMEAWGNLSTKDLEQELKIISCFPSLRDAPGCNKDILMEILSIQISIRKWLDMSEVLVERLAKTRNNSRYLLEYGVNPATALAK